MLHLMDIIIQLIWALWQADQASHRLGEYPWVLKVSGLSHPLWWTPSWRSLTVSQVLWRRNPCSASTTPECPSSAAQSLLNLALKRRVPSPEWPASSFSCKTQAVSGETRRRLIWRIWKPLSTKWNCCLLNFNYVSQQEAWLHNEEPVQRMLECMGKKKP